MQAHKTDSNTHCPEIFSGKRVLIVGLGKTGLSCVRMLQQRGVKFAVTDTRLQPPGLKLLQEEYPDVPVFVGDFNRDVFANIDVLVVSPGVSIHQPLIEECARRGAEILGDIEIFARCCDRPVVAITGSNGKSTVTTLVGEMVRHACIAAGVGGNLGTPALDLLLSDAQMYVLELSSFQLETTHTLNATASTILNISEDHMDRYDALSDYALAKARVFQGHGAVICNIDDPLVMELVEKLPAGRTVYGFTLSEPATANEFGVRLHQNEEWLAQGKQLLMPVSQMKIKGKHNVANALAAIALGVAVKLPMPAMLQALREFPGLPHRSQWILEKNGIAWFNDSKGTNVGAALAAIAGTPANKLIVILGGQGKGQDFTPLRPVLKSRARHVLLLGEDARLIAQALTHEVPHSFVKTLDDAISQAKTMAQPGDAVLLSPACASFDMFNGYEHRGEMFMQSVRAMV